jgi:hypothetical protein
MRDQSSMGRIVPSASGRSAQAHCLRGQVRAPPKFPKAAQSGEFRPHVELNPWFDSAIVYPPLVAIFCQP